MTDHLKTKAQLIAELQALRAEIATLKKEQVNKITETDLASRQYTILLVDDSPTDRYTYQRYLTKNQLYNYQIVEFDNGNNALLWCENHQPDVMVIDYFLPDMDGLEFLEKIWHKTGEDRIPALMITGQGNTNIAVELLKRGAQDYLEKNHVTAKILNQAITNILRQSHIIKQQKWQQQRQQIITTISLSIRNYLNIEDILKTTVTEVRGILESDRAIIYQFQPDGTGLVVQESVANPALSIFGWVIKEECFPEMWIEPYKQGKTRTINDVITDPSLTECHREFLTSLMIRANLIVPIIQGENLWGLLIAHQCTAPRNWTTADVELMNQLAIQVGIAIQQASLIEKLQTELTQRIQAEKILQERDKQLELFVKYAPAAIAMFDRNMHYLTASQRWIDDYQLESLEAIIGKSHYQIFPEITERWQQIHQRSLAGAVEKCDQDLFLREDGLNQWLSWEVRPWFNVNNEICGLIIFSEDITERKQAELALQKFNIQLEQRVTERTLQLSQAYDNLQRELLQREKLERELKNREKLLDGFFYAASQANVGLSIVDTNLRFLKINQKLANINGHSIEAHLGKTVMELIPEIAATVSPLLQTILDTKQPICNLEISGSNPSQPEEIGYWITSYFPILGETGNAVAVGSIIIEITERKRLEMEREKLIGIIDATSDIIGTVKFETQKTEYVNKAGRRLLGLADDAPTEHISIADVHPQWALEIIQNQGIPAAVKNGVWVGETAFLNHEGKEIPISQVLIAQTFGSNYTQYLSTIARDITEQKQIEATLKESDRRWRSLLNNVQLIVIGLDINSNVEYANSFFLQLSNYTETEVLGKNWFDNFLPQSQHNLVETYFQEVIEKNFHAHYQNPILTKSGEERIISWSNTLLRDIEGKPIGTISIGEDITERYKLDRMKAEFISVVSHELRTPLTSMQAGLSLLHDKIIDANSPEGEATIEIATEGVDRLVRLVNDILDLERLESGKIKLEKSLCNTAELINTAIEQMQDMATQASIIINATPSSYQVHADSDRILQVLINLLSNAIKFSPPHSIIWLTVEEGNREQGTGNSKEETEQGAGSREKLFVFSQSPVTSHQSPLPIHLLFTVKDQGRGIPSHSLNSIFERFHQVDASDSRSKGGTGLGLAICRNIVEHHGGAIWAESVLGEGSTFYFTLPIEEVSNGE